MIKLIETVEKLKNSKVKEFVDTRIKEFKETGKGSNDEIFNELCFCIMTANFNAERSIKIQNEIKDGFYYFTESQLIDRLETLGHRYPAARAKYIIEARKHKDFLKRTMDIFENEKKLREWFVKKVKGFGYKEASHFLRNIGYENLAIIDFHIIDLLVRHGLIERPKTLTPKKYLEIEEILKTLADKLNITLGELDLYLWYIETDKILK